MYAHFIAFTCLYIIVCIIIIATLSPSLISKQSFCAPIYLFDLIIFNKNFALLPFPFDFVQHIVSFRIRNSQICRLIIILLCAEKLRFWRGGICVEIRALCFHY